MKTNNRNIRTGDLIFFPPTGPVGKIISFVTWSKYCHVALAVVDTKGEIWLREYREFGCREVLLDVAEYEWGFKKDQHFDVYRCCGIGRHSCEFIAEKMLSFPKDYGYFHFLWIAFYMLFWRKITKCFVKKECDKHAPTCSEAACRAYRETVGIDLVPGIPDRLTSPGDLIRAKKLYQVN